MGLGTRATGAWAGFGSIAADLPGPGLLVSGQVTLYSPQRVTESHLDLLESPGTRKTDIRVSESLSRF